MMIQRTVSTPIGDVRLIGTASTLRELQLPPIELAPSDTTPSPALDEAERQLAEYFAGERTEFDLPLELVGTAFQKEVWNALLSIGFGETMSYVDIARQIGRPLASRAVGQANARNPIAIVVPCHRVIAADNSLGGYGGGLLLKRKLLAHEGCRSFQSRSGV